MNEFEALKRLRQETCPATYMPDFNKEECCDVIEQALLELKAIKEAKPSEALECLGALIKETKYDIDHKNDTGYSVETQERYTTYLNDRMIILNTIKQALLKADKLEKAIKCIERLSAYNIELKEHVFVNKLIYIFTLIFPF